MRAHVALTIAGSDSGGGAGITADLKTFEAHGVWGTTALVAVTAQNTLGVQAFETLPAALVRKQIESVAVDIGIDAAKTGMLSSTKILEAVAAALRRNRVPNLVVDPVMVAKGGHRLLLSEAETALRDELLPMATLITPNLPEAAVLAGFPVRVEADMVRAAEKLRALGARAVLMKGGHLDGDRVVDLLFYDGGVDRFEDARIPGRHTHGTGCTLASAIAAGLAQKMSLSDSFRRARTYVRKAIESAPGYGRGHGPLDHAVTVRPTGAS